MVRLTNQQAIEALKIKSVGFQEEAWRKRHGLGLLPKEERLLSYHLNIRGAWPGFITVLNKAQSLLPWRGGWLFSDQTTNARGRSFSASAQAHKSSVMSKSLRSFKSHLASSHSLLCAPSEPPPASDKGSKESKDWPRLKANFWLLASAPPHNTVFSFSLRSGQKRKPKHCLNCNDSLFQIILQGNKRVRAKCMENAKCTFGTRSPAHTSLWVYILGSFDT